MQFLKKRNLLRKVQDLLPFFVDSQQFVSWSQSWCIMGGQLCSTTRRVREYRSICATGRWLWSRWRPCSPAVSEGESQREVRRLTHAKTRTLAPFTDVAQEPDHAFWPAHAYQHDLVAEQDLQGHENEDLTGAADHFVPHSE